MKLLKSQRLYMLEVHHNSTLQGAFRWWLKRRNKYCKSFCPLCEFYYRCQEDVEMEKMTSYIQNKRGYILNVIKGDKHNVRNGYK